MGIDDLGGPKTPERAERPDMKKLMVESGFRLSVPERSETFEGTTQYEGFETLADYKTRIDKAVAACRYFLSNGVFIFDDFGNEHPTRRRAQEDLRDSIRAEYGDEPAAEYWGLRNNNYLRAGGMQQLMMTRVLDSLGNNLTDIDTLQAKRTCEIVARFPKIRKKYDAYGNSRYELSDPKFQWMVDLIAGMELKDEDSVTESTPYQVMTDEQKTEIVGLLDGIARDFLRLVVKKEENGSVSGVGLEPRN